MNPLSKFLTELFEYSNHYNQQLSEVFLAHADKTSEKSVKLFSHVLNAHHIWNNRIEGIRPLVTVWQVHDASVFKKMDQENYENSIRILRNFDLEKELSYTNSQGQQFSNNIRDILFHVINHCTYHRAQIATEFKQAGLEPVTTDYIFYRR